jgi:hypothetical protein
MATRTISNTGGNWNSTSTWVEGIVPTAADDVVATPTSGNLSSNSVTNSCLSLNLTNYTRTLTITSALYVYGDVTLGNGTTIGGTTYLYIRANSNITSNGVIIPYLRFVGGDVLTINLIDDLHVGTQFYLTTGTNVTITAITINNNNIYCYGGFYYEGFSRLFGTANLIIAGTGNLYGNNQFGEIYNPVIINSPSGTITIIGEMNIATSLTYISGTVTMNSGSINQLIIRGTGSKIIDFSPVVIWSGITLYSVTASLLTDLYTNDLGLESPVLNSSSISVYGNLGSVGSQGTTEIVIAGSGSWSSNASFYQLRNNLTIKTTGSFTITGSNDSTMNYYTGKITYISGTVIQPTTLNIINSTTFDTSGMTWNKLNIREGTMTLSSSLNATTMSLGQNLSLNNQTTFTGSAGFNTKVLSINNNNYFSFIDLTPGITYNVSNNFISSGSNQITFRASSSIDRAYFNLAPTGSQNVKLTNATNIDSSGGQTIFSLGGTLINSINWSNYPSNFFLLFE